jgi:hypothetical protein
MSSGLKTMKWMTAGAVGILALAGSVANAQPPAGGGPGGRGGRGGRGPALFNSLDKDKDGSVSRAELKETFNAWFRARQVFCVNSLPSTI